MWNFLSNFSGTELIVVIIALILAITFAITIHEYAHARAAVGQGDTTPILTHRYTLNPFAHFDLFGFLSLLILGFGWAKPVQVNPLRYREYRKGTIQVSFAGILTNIMTAFLSAGIYLFLLSLIVTFTTTGFAYYLVLFLVYFFELFCVININLAVLNIIPVYPLDGFNLLSAFVKRENKVLNFLKQYGFVILLVVILTSTYGISYVTNYIYTNFLMFWGFAV